MFGYLRLRGETAAGECAPSHYRCGLCAVMGRSFRQRARLLVGDDVTLLGVLLEGLAAEAPRRVAVRCPCPPFTRRPAIDPDWEPLLLLASIQIFLVGEKLIDDRIDRDRPLARAIGAIYAADLEQAEAQLRERGLAVDALRRAIRRQTEVERDAAADLDELSEPSGQLLARLLAFCAARAGCPASGAVSAFGERLGRTIYLVDAISDLRRDAQRGKYNGIAGAVGHVGPSAARYLRSVLHGRLDALQGALEEVPLQRHRALIARATVGNLRRQGERALAKLPGGSPPQAAAPA